MAGDGPGSVGAQFAFGERELEVTPEVLALVKAVKLGRARSDLVQENILAAHNRHRMTPTILVPSERGREYAVVVQPPAVGFLENGSNLSLEEAILRLDVRRLMLVGQPVA